MKFYIVFSILISIVSHQISAFAQGILSTKYLQCSEPSGSQLNGTKLFGQQLPKILISCLIVICKNGEVSFISKGAWCNDNLRTLIANHAQELNTKKYTTTRGPFRELARTSTTSYPTSEMVPETTTELPYDREAGALIELKAPSKHQPERPLLSTAASDALVLISLSLASVAIFVIAIGLSYCQLLSCYRRPNDEHLHDLSFEYPQVDMNFRYIRRQHSSVASLAI